ncbi:Ig-like domain-containing protein [Ureibacillus xyleni]|uniref:Ig-like domain-containing protein n=1 Tax=Ureibacillus xyleni TaxID=614648 RepID=A0A285REF7_9BACL|nr:Ig-like domain-containing protein [Ureibacillus xyleni]SOB90757.1 Ig-like domain-containing protein [Ureibacillus xyleni]
MIKRLGIIRNIILAVFLLTLFSGGNHKVFADLNTFIDSEGSNVNLFYANRWQNLIANLGGTTLNYPNPTDENFENAEATGCSTSNTTIGGWTYEIKYDASFGSEPCLDIIEINSDKMIDFMSTSGGNQFIRISTSSGIEVKLNSFELINHYDSGPSSYKVVGYKNGIEVNGATQEFTLINQTVNLTNPAWGNIDEFRILRTDSSTSDIVLQLDDIDISIPKSNNTNLSNLSLSANNFSKSLNPNLDYQTVEVPSSTINILIMPILQDPNAAVMINNQPSNQPIFLDSNSKLIEVNVTAEEPSVKKMYRIMVIRLLPPPNVQADDINNVITGFNESYEYQFNGGSWNHYNLANLPDLSGDVTVKVRIPANGPGMPPSEEAALTFSKIASLPTVTPATTKEVTMNDNGLEITPHAIDEQQVTHFKITGITGGTLYYNDGTWPIGEGTFISKSEAAKGLKFKPNPDANTKAGDTFNFKVQAAFDNQGTGLSDQVTATITVTEVNDPPNAADDQLPNIEQNSNPISIPFSQLLANDTPGPVNESGQELMIKSVQNATGGEVRTENGHVIFTPNTNFRGQAKFEYTVEDNGTSDGVSTPETSQAVVTINVLPKADAPTVTNADTSEDTQSSSGLVITRSDSITTHYKISNITGGKLYYNDGTREILSGDFITVSEGEAGLKFTPLENQFGSTGFGFSVQAAPNTKGTLLSDVVEATINVREVNDAPIVQNDQLGDFAVNTPLITIPVSDLLYNDKKGPDNEDGQTLSIITVGNAQGGTVTIVNGEYIEFTPDSNFQGTAEFDYMAQDDGKTNSTNDFKTATGKASFNILDKTPPTITLNGDTEIYIELGSVYQEPGFSAEDDIDQDLTGQVVVSGVVNPNELGPYQLKYNVIDSNNNHANEVIRTVHVVSAELNTLSISKGNLTPAFVPSELNYTAKVPNSIDKIDVNLSALDSTATMTLNGEPIGQNAAKTVPLKVGSNPITVVVTSLGGATKTYTLVITREVYIGGGGSTPPPQPKPEIITVPVETGGSQQGSNVSTAIIERTTDANGNKRDNVELTADKAKETVEKLKEAGSDTARIVIPDTKDEVSEVNVSVNKSSLDALKQGNINLEIFTDNARIAIPKDSLGEIQNDLYFRVVPIKEQQKQNEVKERAKQEEVVREVAGSLNINVVGRPMTIETNMPNRPVDLVLPLKDVTIPENAKEREDFFNKLGVFIEHSDGEKVFIKGEVVPYKNGELGLKFTIRKFSTFTIINMENGWDQKEPNFNDQFKGKTSEAKTKVMADKVWNVQLNQTLQPASINEKTVYMYNEAGEKVEIKVQLTNNNRTISVSPKTYYKPGTKYYLYLSDEIKSSFGTPLKETERFVFETTAYSLETGKWLEKNNVSAQKAWTVSFNSNVKKELVSGERIFVTDEQGQKVAVNLEVTSSNIVTVTPKEPYQVNKTYYLFIQDLASSQDVKQKEQTWMKFTVGSDVAKTSVVTKSFEVK